MVVISTLVSRSNANNKSVNHNFNLTGYLEFQPIKNLVYRGQLNYNHSTWSYRSFESIFNANGTNSDTFLTEDKATNQLGTSWGWSTTNTLSYKFDVKEHNFDILVGTEYGESKPDFGFSLTGYAALGQQIARSYRKFADGNQENFTTEVYSYWNGEGTSNKYPLFNRMNEGTNWMTISDIYVEDADYFRLQNITLGYDFKNIWKNCPFQQLRLYVQAQNLFTITGYKGMDPECGKALNDAEPWVTGVDIGNYPQPRTYMVGVNVKF